MGVDTKKLVVDEESDGVFFNQLKIIFFIFRFFVEETLMKKFYYEILMSKPSKWCEKSKKAVSKNMRACVCVFVCMKTLENLNFYIV